MKKRIICSIVLILCAFGCVYAQADSVLSSKEDSAVRPKIGLVLSGGGAKGLAHIGVLKALEQNNIPIDYIAGTSMGAIIGGLYASGYSPEEIEQIFYSEELNEWLSSKIADKYKSYLHLPSSSSALLSVGFDIDRNFKAEIPLSLINPIQMDFAFNQFFASANEACGEDFGKLMIPFFCIASDVGQRKQVLLDHGNLGRCIRASMTFPFFFSPIDIDGHLLCDGGVYNNFPSYEMMELYNPDILIGVKVAGNFDEPNAEDLVLYIENMVAVDSRYDLPCQRSLMIEPDMSFVDIMDFSKRQQCIQMGYLSACEKADSIKLLLGVDSLQQDYNGIRQRFNAKKKHPVLGNILVHGVDEKAAVHIDKLLTMNLNKDSIYLEDIKPNYLTVADLPAVSSLNSQVYYDNFLKTFILDVNVKTKNLLIAKVGGILSTDPISNMFVGLEYNFFHRYAYKMQINGYFGRYYAASGLDFRMDIPNRTFPFYLKGEININRWNYFRNRTGLFEYSANNYLVQREADIQLKFGVPAGRRGKIELKTGIGFTNDKYFNNNLISSYDTNDVTTFQNFVAGVLFEINTLNNDIYPTRGSFIKFNMQLVTGKEEFIPGTTYTYDPSLYQGNVLYSKNHSWAQAQLETKFFKNVTERYSAGLITKYFHSFQELFSTRRSSLLNAGYFAPTLETFTRFYPEYRANQFAAAGTEQSFKIGSSFLGETSLRGGLYGFLPIREILANDDNQPYYGNLFSKFYFIGALSFITATPLGNLSLSLSYTQREDTALTPWNISLSFGTVIFNNKNIDR
ncbi:MAG: patatin-like phospholipase family protein [Bacteroidales bacterium]|nr:patatin-like phospholipase family protein [Bacteroidales bacterium]